MSDTCANCNGLIMKPGVSYSYAGPVCHCPVRPMWQMPRREPDPALAALLKSVEPALREIEKIAVHELQYGGDKLTPVAFENIRDLARAGLGKLK